MFFCEHNVDINISIIIIIIIKKVKIIVTLSIKNTAGALPAGGWNCSMQCSQERSDDYNF